MMHGHEKSDLDHVAATRPMRQDLRGAKPADSRSSSRPRRSRMQADDCQGARPHGPTLAARRADEVIE